MPDRSEIAYFGAGPAPLPTSVLEEGAKAFVNYNDSGLSLVEISHRSSTATGIIDAAKASLSRLMDIPDDYEILFCHGGGSGGFASVVYNLVPVWIKRQMDEAAQKLGADHPDLVATVQRAIKTRMKLDYIVTGSWSLKASQEAANLLAPLGSGLVNVAADSRKSGRGRFDSIVDESEWFLSTPSDSVFTYFCDNETVDGVEFPQLPACLQNSDRIVVADMSSNFLSRKVDVSKYGVIFGGAQKNIGITDVTIVIVRKSLLQDQASPEILHKLNVWSPPTIMHWPTLAKNNSLYNTLPIFSVFIANRVMEDLLEKHGSLTTGSQETESAQKAQMLYEVLDSNPELFKVCPQRNARSRMNLCFRIANGDAAMETEFLVGAEKWGLQGLKGHRSVGGIRASNYNAVSTDNVRKLAHYLRTFAAAQH